MHEVGIITQAVDIAVDAARRSGAERVVRLKLRVGEYSGAVPDALAFGFDVVTKGTIAEGAMLEIERVPALCRCDACDREFRPEGPVFFCPHCGVPSSTILSGRELDVAEIEVAD
ncbi:MAG TPA: hydrogenase maturation nickel metallochaperone HypA [Fimbriimonadaceae bacterium]|nr:hydrogenase maturation nickel metallochaperone HypA [Fimbriimonadaceae bacterium]